MSVKLTKTLIDKLKHSGDGRRCEITWDSIIPGLGVRVYPSGKKAFVLSYRFEGRKKQRVIGNCEVLGIDNARTRARRYLINVIDGIDPFEQRQGCPTFAKFVERFVKSHVIPTKKPSTIKEYKRQLDTVLLPKFGDLRLDQIRKADIVEFHQDYSQKSPTTANRHVALISAIYNKAIEWDLPVSVNPAKGISKNREIKRDRFVTPEELPKLMSAIEGLKSPYAKAAFKLYLLTGLRRSELLRASWDDIDLKAKVWTIEDTKNRSTHRIPLSSQALLVLKGIPRQLHNPYVFCSSRGNSHLVDLKKPWASVLKEAGIKDLRLHDLRRTVGSYLAQSGKSLHLIGKVLNHADSSSTEIYAHFQDSDIRDALEEYGSLITQLQG